MEAEALHRVLAGAPHAHIRPQTVNGNEQHIVHRRARLGQQLLQAGRAAVIQCLHGTEPPQPLSHEQLVAERYR